MILKPPNHPETGLEAAVGPLLGRLYGQPHIGHSAEGLRIPSTLGRRVLVRPIRAVPLLVADISAEDALAGPTFELVRPTGCL